MLQILRRSMPLAPALSVLGCASYHVKPLDPDAELAALRGRTLDAFVVERAHPGVEGPAAPPPFDPSDGLDEAELVSVALTLNPDLQAKRRDIGQSQALLIAAGLWPNPEVGVGWRPGISGAAGTTADADLVFALLRPGERALRAEAASARLQQAQAAVTAEEWRTVAEVRGQHVTALATDAVSALLEEELGLRRRALDLVRQRHAIGEGTRLDVSAAELELADVRRERFRARLDADTARREMNRLLGLPPEHVLRLSAGGKPFTVTLYDDLPDEEVDRRLVAGRFELRALEAAYRAAEQNLHLAVLRQYPGVKVGPSFAREPEGDNYLGVGAGVEIPLFDRNQGEIAEKASLRERARAEYAALLHRLRAAAVEARGRLRSALLEVNEQENEALPAVRRTQDLFEGAFRARELGVLDWVTAQQRILKARQAHLDALARYHKAVIELESATGMPLSRQAAPAPENGK